MHVHIVGFGIAGALLARELIEREVHVTANDVADPESSSHVAAGMITPITGKRLKPTWRGPELTMIAKQVYQTIERASGLQIWHDWTLRRVFGEPQMQTWFEERSSRNEFNHLEVRAVAPGMHAGTRFPYGGFEHAGVATVDLSAFIGHVSKQVELTSDVRDSADAVVWCTGYKALYHELWSWLPIEPSKGEILDVVIDDVDMDFILTNGTWILPVIRAGKRVSGQYRVGATHDWDDHDPLPTIAAREYLLGQAKQMIDAEIQVVGHRAAIRPSTQFKRPLVGAHPIEPRTYVFTGLGTKGALQGPWAARELASAIVDGTPLDYDIDCQRWWKKQ